MDIQKFTQKSLEAIQGAQELAIENQNAQIEQEHLLLALLEQDNSLIKELLKRMKIDENAFGNYVKERVEKKPKITGGARPNDGFYVSQDVDLVLTKSEKIAKNMKDEYVSVEHIMISLMDNANKEVKDLFTKYNINKK